MNGSNKKIKMHRNDSQFFERELLLQLSQASDPERSPVFAPNFWSTCGFRLECLLEECLEQESTAEEFQNEVRNTTTVGWFGCSHRPEDRETTAAAELE